MAVPSLNSTSPNKALESFTAANQNNNTEAVAAANSQSSELKSETKKPSLFENFLNRSENSTRPSNETLNQKLADIKHKGRLVSSHPLPEVVKDYIRDIKSFLTDVKDHAYEHQMSEEGNKKLFEKMELIDNKLVEIADKVIDDQKTELELVASLGDLEGLLIDFYI